MRKYNHLFKPYKFRTFEVPNRIVMPPMAIYTPGANGFVTPGLVDYYEARAAGGPGLIIMGATAVTLPSGTSHPNMTAISEDKYIPGLRELVDAVHAQGPKILLQLYHSGRQRYGMIAGGETLSPAGIPDPVRKDPTRAITKSEIQRLVEEYAAAAKRAQTVGFDGVEIHCAHGYLLSGFLSPYQNTRQDEYGGDLMGRTRIVREILKRCREAVGSDMLIGIRINGHDYVNGGNTLHDAQQIAQVLVEAGAEYIHVSAGMAPSGHYTFLPAAMPRGCNVHLAKGIKEAVGEKVPVIAVGAIEVLPYAEEVLSTTGVDLVAVGRPLFADPELIKKTIEGREAEIRPCLRCSKCAGTWPDDMRCVVNPAVGRERAFAEGLKPAARSKRVLVIGAGPAGLEAARVAAIRGHKVTIMERAGEIGGKIHMAMIPPSKGDNLNRWLQYYLNELTRLGVTVELNRNVTVQDVRDFNPDTVVVATGGRPLVPRSIEGTHLPNVVTAEDALVGAAQVGRRVAIVGGSSLGVETAEYLLEDPDVDVTVIEMQSEILSDISHDAKLALLDRVESNRFHYRELTLVTGIAESDEGLQLCVRKYGHDGVIKGFDTVVLACGVTPNNSLGLESKQFCSEVYLVGDCESPGDFRKAVHDGAAVGLAI
jgi:2,4-dienoyl-CoA reductase-like NADH-dependent reductase (Old Yellow Enzyme family)/thioredoxin reductase